MFNMMSLFAMPAFAMPVFLAMGAFFLFFMVIVVLIFVFWIWMLIECVMRKKFDDKLIWVLVIIFLHFIGALLYYFLVHKKKK